MSFVAIGGLPAEDVVVRPSTGQPPQRVAGRAVQGVGTHDNQARPGCRREQKSLTAGDNGGAGVRAGSGS